MARSIAQNYRKAQVSTAGPGQRVVLMYEGLVKELKKGKINLVKAQKEISAMEAAHNALSLASQIILELRLALDMDKGGEIAENLRDLYDFWTIQISNSNTQKDAKLLSPVISMAEELRDTWKEASSKARQIGA
jgi:flagellar secretion chaperone FliS